MDLKQFARLIVTDANEAKNHISFLIGNLANKKSAAKAILGLYDSFPDSYKDKSLFTPIMLKFFSTYDVTSENISYYNEFSPGWNSSSNEAVKARNPNWEWTKTEFKNSLEFSRALQGSRTYKNPNKMFEFLENNSETLEKLITKNKNKLIENMSKQKCWHELALTDYDKFSQFCKKYDFDKINILKTEFIDSYWGIDKLIFEYDKKQFFTLFKDLEKEDFFKLFENTQFLANDSKHNPDVKNRNPYMVIEVVLRFIAENRIEEADFLVTKFPEHIQQNFNKYCCKNTPSTDTLEGLGQCVKAISEDSRGNRHSNSKLSIYAERLPTKFNTFKEYVEIIKFKESLDLNIIEKSTKSPQRKL